MKKLTLKMLIISISSVLFISTSYAGSYNNSHQYRGHNSGYNKQHTPRYNYGHSNNYRNRGHVRTYRSHDQYRVHRHHSQCGHQYYPQSHSYGYSNGHVSNSVTYIEYGANDHTAATIVGGAIGGVVANDLSHGDGVATAIGVVTGAIIAVGLDH